HDEGRDGADGDGDPVPRERAGDQCPGHGRGRGPRPSTDPTRCRPAPIASTGTATETGSRCAVTIEDSAVRLAPAATGFCSHYVSASPGPEIAVFRTNVQSDFTFVRKTATLGAHA